MGQFPRESKNNTYHRKRMNEQDVYVWAARDMDDELYLYTEKPCRIKRYFGPSDLGCWYLKIDSDYFREITWENSPVKIKLISTLCNN